MKLGAIPEQVLIVAAGVIVAGLIYHYASNVALIGQSQDGFRFHVL